MTKLLTIITLALLALLAPGTVTLDGTLRGWAWQPAGALRVDLGWRRLALAFVEYRPGRVYYRLAAGAHA